MIATLQALLSAPNEERRERAWEEFLREHSGVLLHAARSLGGDHDAVMDRYSFVLDALRRDDWRRLRSYAPNGHGKFTTWLIVVARRLCLDEYRRKYGRVQSDGVAARAQQQQRRNLADLLGGELDIEKIEAPGEGAPDAIVLRAELQASLSLAVGALDPSDRLLLRLRFVDELSVPEIARLMGGASPFTLYRRVDKLLSWLRTRLNGAGVDGPGR